MYIDIQFIFILYKITDREKSKYFIPLFIVTIYEHYKGISIKALYSLISFTKKISVEVSNTHESLN